MTYSRAEWVKYGFLPEIVAWVELDVKKVLDPSTGDCVPLRNHLFGPIFDASIAAPPWYMEKGHVLAMSCWWCGKTYYHITKENPEVFTFKRYRFDDTLCFYELTRITET